MKNPLILAITFVLTLAAPALSESTIDSEYEQGLACYKARNYRTAAKHFEASLNLGNGAAPNSLYLANSLALSGNKAEALKRYREVAKGFKGLAPEQVALRAIRQLDPHNQYRDPVAAAEAAEKRKSRVAFANRITVIDPTVEGHPRVGPETIGRLKSIMAALPATVYKILDEGNCTVHVGPNIIDKWPDALNASKPGMEEITLAQESARCYGRDIYIWERRTLTGTKDLGAPLSSEELKSQFLYQLGHALDDCLGPLWETKEFRKQFDLDKVVVPDDQKIKLKYYLQPEYKGCGEVIATIVSKYLGDTDYDERVEKYFPRCKDLILRTLERTRTGMSGLASKSSLTDGQSKDHVQTYGKMGSTLSGITPKNFNKNVTTSKAAPVKPEEKDKPGDVTPAEETVRYTRSHGDHLYIPGTINGQPIEWLFDTGAFRVCLPKQYLGKIGVPLPKEPAKVVGHGARGPQNGWEMDLDVSVGKIKRRLTVNVFEDETVPPLLGQPFLRGMHYRIDRAAQYIQFTKEGEAANKQVTADAIEVPFRMINDNMIVVAKVNGLNLEMNFDTGAPAVYFSARDLARLKLRVAADNSSYEIDEIELGPMRKQKVKAYSSNSSVLGQTFFGERRFVVDNAKNVIKFSR